MALHDRYRLTAKEAQVVLLLAGARGVVEPTRICDVYCDHPERTSPIEARSAVKRIRKKVAGAIKIKAHYGMGYALEDESIHHIRKITKGVSP